ncbi:MAG TPA: threonine synthase [Methylomirabilota bacterium]|nr:threonine synthase [Methylomirabilota bacterium]
MRYVSTRGAAPALAFDDVLLAGLARDGGLYVPETWPRLGHGELRAMAGLDYAELAVRVMRPFVDGRIEDDAFARLVRDAYTGFGHSAVAPLKQLDGRTWLMELFHGPTLAFKDMALQLLGRLYDHVLRQRGERVTIVGATSGDTGSAAIEAFRDRASADIFILHPQGRVSEVQRRQMTTVLSPNVFNIAVEGTFDDCQDLVKAMFNDHRFRDELNLSAVNSINWARVMAQTVYYVAAAVALGAPDRAVSFAVPTGNFGNVYAGYAARAMGVPIERLIVGSNHNDILTRFFASGRMAIEAVQPSLSPSMDIQVSSNVERLLFDLYDRDGPALAQAMASFRRNGQLAVGEERWKAARAVFDGYRFDDAETLQAIAGLHRQTGELVDPHSAIGVAAAHAAEGANPRSGERGAAPVVALATAHPAKFPDAVERATGRRPTLPAPLADLFERPERVEVLPNDLRTIQGYVRSRRLKGAA